MFRAAGDPVLYLSDPPGIDKTTRRNMLDSVAKLNQMRAEEYGDPEIETRIAQYEMAYRMQTSVPSLMDFSNEPERTFEMYGPDLKKRGTYAANCLLARRLVERGSGSSNSTSAVGTSTAIFHATSPSSARVSISRLPH